MLRPPIESAQYRAIEFSNRLSDWGLTASYGSVGDCFDNSAMEAVWSRLKTEIIDIHNQPLEAFTRSELRTVLFDYIEVFYNRQRHQALTGPLLVVRVLCECWLVSMMPRLGELSRGE